MPPVQSWMRRYPWLTTTTCGCGSSVLSPIDEPYLAKFATAGKPRAERSGAGRARLAARHLHAVAEHRLAGVTGGRGGVRAELVGLVAGDDLRSAVEIDVRDDAQGSVAVSADGAARVGLRAERLAGGAVEHAVA